ncbi:TetR family transcriptional regulator [Oleiphilus messinensis]|uniref:TetR family transcriptional regulator n=1 Tax=Oleiphilus messinensis TaxID=141451 RepID=A0A1Y0I8J2_9GAMM|nr:TetR/AcrR family transcriptional regulator [Oleiphilus messinensis]ARU56519.1 TetR family transcriptional regulator [Oleiphilus messinensis]
MPRTNPEARLRLVATAADMLRRRGMNATSIRELAKAAKAPLGSTYHYFPNGKKQVVIEAVNFAGDKISGMLQKSLEKGAVAGLETFLQIWRDVIESTEFQAGCPVIAVAMEQATNEDVEAAHEAAAKVFNRWQKLLSTSLAEEGIEQSRANALATMYIASAEGALGICRATKDISAFDQVTEQLRFLLETTLKETRTK